MVRFVCLAGAELGDRGAAAAADLDHRSGWVARVRRADFAVWTEGAPAAQPLAGGGILLGTLFARPDAPSLNLEALVASLPSAPRAAGQALVDTVWGDYLAIFPTKDGAAILRDPSGGVDALGWQSGRLAVAASDLAAVPGGLQPLGVGLDWDAIADMFDEPVAAVAQVALAKLIAPLQGRLETVGVAGGEMLWRPERIAAEPLDGDAAARMVATVDACVASLARRHDRLVAEVSGGLDSAIVTTALAASGEAGRVARWLNVYGDRPEGDERAYARAVADRLGVTLTCVAKPLRPLTEADVLEVCRSHRPPVASADPDADAGTAAAIQEVAATALLSGQGGDAVFFQPPTALVAADRLAAEGLHGLRPLALAEAARLSRRSIWAVLWEVRAARRGGGGREALLGLPPGWSRGPRRYRHPWAMAADGLPPAKQLQVRGIANAQLSRIDSRRRRAGALLYPLLAQPVVELCLRIPTYDLARGGRERGLARAAFANRLPTCIVERRGKGDLSAFYARLVAQSLDFIRPYLLEGVLCSAGLLDRAALETLLTPDALVWRGGASGVMQAVTIEAWVRYWQTQVPDAAGAGRPRR